MHNNTAILLTPPGSAAIAVVRLRGPLVTSFLAAHFARPVAPERCTHGQFLDGDRIIDDPVVVLSADGTTADVNLHGGPWIVRTTLDLATRAGFRVIERPTPLDLVAAADGATLLDREIAACLPSARTQPAIRALLDQATRWPQFLRNPSEPDTIDRILADRSLYHLLHPPRIAIIGIPNVGKSTLANQLFAQDRAITADLPGTTRDWVGEIANIDGLAVMLVDTPGLRATDDPLETAAIGRSAPQIAAADLLLLVFDPTQPLEAQQQLLRTHPGALVILNKSDRTPAWNAATIDALHTSATTGRGIDALRHAIREHFGLSTPPPPHPRWWTGRQRALLERARHDPAVFPTILD